MKEMANRQPVVRLELYIHPRHDRLCAMLAAQGPPTAHGGPILIFFLLVFNIEFYFLSFSPLRLRPVPSSLHPLALLLLLPLLPGGGPATEPEATAANTAMVARPTAGNGASPAAGLGMGPPREEGKRVASEAAQGVEARLADGDLFLEESVPVAGEGDTAQASDRPCPSLPVSRDQGLTCMMNGCPFFLFPCTTPSAAAPLPLGPPPVREPRARRRMNE